MAPPALFPAACLHPLLSALNPIHLSFDLRWLPHTAPRPAPAPRPPGRCREVINELDTLAGGCCLCHEVDFQRGGFGPRTILFCDQCEREFHVGCLKAAGTADLQAVPEGEWGGVAWDGGSWPGGGWWWGYCQGLLAPPGHRV